VARNLIQLGRLGDDTIAQVAGLTVGTIQTLHRDMADDSVN